MYKMPIDCSKKAGRLAAMLQGQAKLIAEKLEPRMAKVLEEGEKMPDVAHLIDVLARMVVADSKSLDEVDEGRNREGFRGRRARKKLREKAVPKLHSLVSEIRRQMVNFFGAQETALLLRFKGRTPRGREDLKDLATYMVRLLPFVKAPQAAGVIVDPARWSELLEPALDDVSRLMSEAEGHGWDEEDAVGAKQEAMAAFDRLVNQVAGVAENLYKLAGLERFVKYLRYEGGRPSEQKKSQGAA